MLGDDVVTLLSKNGPMSRADIATATGYSQRHLQRVLPAVRGIRSAKQGHKILYSVAAAAAASTTSSSITTAESEPKLMSSVQHGQPGQMSSLNVHVERELGQQGHFEKTNTKQRHRIAKRDAKNHTPATIPAQFAPGTPRCQDDGTNLCPQFYAGFERDMIQFVLMDRTFRDLLVQQASAEPSWQVNENRGLMWIRVNDKHLTLQAGKDTVVFYSDEPGDLSAIAGWVRDKFGTIYKDIDSLVSRIRTPQNLSAEELTVVIRHPEVISSIRTSIAKDSKNGQFNIIHPSEKIPGLKIYESNGTMRVEFIVHNYASGLSAIDMRAELMGMLPRIKNTPGLFWEFIQKYYSGLHHPIIIDTGGHEFLTALERIAGVFAEAIKVMQGRPIIVQQQVSAPAVKENDAVAATIAELEQADDFDIERIIGTFARTMKLERQAVLVYLAAWSAWQGRNFKGRVLKEDISKLLRNEANEPLALSCIADAIDQLQEAGLMKKDPRYDVKFTEAAIMIARKLAAKREGMQ